MDRETSSLLELGSCFVSGSHIYWRGGELTVWCRCYHWTELGSSKIRRILVTSMCSSFSSTFFPHPRCLSPTILVQVLPAVWELQPSYDLAARWSSALSQTERGWCLVGFPASPVTVHTTESRCFPWPLIPHTWLIAGFLTDNLPSEDSSLSVMTICVMLKPVTALILHSKL